MQQHFFYLTLRIMEIKTKNKQMRPLQTCTAKETINKMKRQPTDWEKNLWMMWPDKGLVSKFYKQCMMLNSIKTNNSVNKWAEDLNRYFSKEDIQMAKRHIKRCSTLLIIREMKNKTTMSYHLTLARMAIIKKSTKKKRWRECEEKGTLLHCWWECKLVQLLWRTVWKFLKILKIELPYMTQQSHSWVYIQRKP